jgi:hypothetical protein
VTVSQRTPVVELGWSLLTALILVALLGWLAFLPARAHGRSTRPPLITPVSLDWINEPRPAPAAKSPSSQPSSSVASEPTRDGLKAW